MPAWFKLCLFHFSGGVVFIYIWGVVIGGKMFFIVELRIDDSD